MIELIKQVAVPLSWAALPVGLWCLIDSWLFAPRRAVAAGTPNPPDPMPVKLAYEVLPYLMVAVIVRMITAESLDFSLVLLLLSVATGIIWLVDNLFFRKARAAAAAEARPVAITLPEPGTVDYARSFFPVAAIVLVVRAFVFEPFRIPSDSMMPTLLDGDFIVVNKYAYGLRWPVLNEKFMDVGTPQRGDVVVFKFPPNPSQNYIKRLVGLPGDRIEVRDDQLIVNGEVIELKPVGQYTDGCYVDVRLSEEKLGEHTHQVMSCRSENGIPPMLLDYSGSTGDMPACNRKEFRKRWGNRVCRETPAGSSPDSGDSRFPFSVVPEGHYLMIGDNRDNSDDSRGSVGLVPEQNLVGKATRIWFNFDYQRDFLHWVNWGRIGDGIP